MGLRMKNYIWVMWLYWKCSDELAEVEIFSTREKARLAKKRINEDSFNWYRVTNITKEEIQ
jgi:hypothetical protein